MFKDKYRLSPEQSLFLAKKKWDENVYCGMKMENRAVTFPQTKTILDGINVPNVRLDDIQAILNMRDAWRFVINTICEPISVSYMCKINEFIARNESLEWGVLRNGNVSISGTNYVPPIPNEETVKRQFNHIISSGMSATEVALDLFLWGARGQFFWDGNKRTSMLLANKIMISNGVGMINICDKDMAIFNELLLQYYNSGNRSRIKMFLYERAIQGIMFK